jgi:putative Mn2+ efflux pump MntP
VASNAHAASSMRMLQTSESWYAALQIATIGLAASTDVVGVTLGGIFGHSLCTGAAVIGGRHLATFVDERTMSILGGLLFIAFGAHAYWEVCSCTKPRFCILHFAGS